MTAPIILGITIRANGSAPVTGEIDRVRQSVTGAGNSAQGANRQFASYAESMRSAEQAALAIQARIASATAIYDAQVARLTMTSQAYRAYQLQMDGLHPSQIRHIQNLEATAISAGVARTAVNGLNAAMGAIGVGIGLATLVALAADIFKTNMAMEQLRVQLISVTGSAAVAEQAFNDVLKVAKDTPQSVEQISKAYIMLKNFGIQPAMQVMEDLTNMTSKLGGSSDTLTGITLALGQAFGKGKLQAQDANQMIERGVPVWDLLSKVAGKNAIELNKMMDAGELTRPVIEKLIRAMGEESIGASKNAMNTLAGQVNILGDAWHRFEDVLLNDKSEGLIKSIIGNMSGMLDGLANMMDVTLQEKISHAQRKINMLNQNGFLGSLVDGLAGNSVAEEQAKIDSLQQQISKNKTALTQADEVAARNKKAQEAANTSAQVKALEIERIKEFGTQQQKETQAITEATDKYGVLTAAMREQIHAKIYAKQISAASTAAHKEEAAAKKEATKNSKAIADELSSLDAKHEKLMLSERDYYAQSAALANMTPAVKAFALAQWDVNHALEGQKKSTDAAQSEMDSLIDKYNQLTMSAQEYFATKLKAAGITTADAAPLIVQNNKNVGIEDAAKSHDSATAALIAYNSTLDTTLSKTQDLSGLTSAVFDGALGGISAMTGALTAMVDQIKSNTDQMVKLNEAKQAIADFKPQGIDEAALKFKSEKKNIAEIDALNKKSLNDNLTGIRQIAGDFGNMFGKKTAAAKAFHAIESGIAAVQMVMKMQEIAMSLTATGVKTAEGGATMFAQSGWAGFAGVAAMIAVMASLGFGSKGSSTASAPPPTSPDTGTVLGDSTAKSDSVNKTYTLLKDIHASEYIELRGINNGVAALSSGITNVITRLFQAGGITDPSIKTNLGMIGIGGAINGPGLGAHWLLNGLFGGDVKQEITGGGLATGATSLASVRNNGNLNSNQYTTIKKTVDGGWFGSDKVSYYNQYQAIDTATQKALNGVFKSMGDTMFGLAKNLGGNLTQKVNEYIIPAMTIELRGLNGEDAARKLNGVISTALDTMSMAVFGSMLAQYQQLGEGMLETTVRIVSEMAVVKDALSLSGLALKNNLISISDALVTAAGGLAAFQTAFGIYFDKFYSDNEKVSRSYNTLSGELLGVLTVLPATRAEYRKLIESLDLSNIADQERYSMLIKLSSAADAYYTALEAQTKAYTDAVATAKNNLASAYKTEADALNTTISKMTGFIDTLKKFRDGLVVGALAVGNSSQKYEAAKSKFNATSSTINSGYGATDASKTAFTNAVGALSTDANNFLAASMASSATSLDYARDFNKVLAATQKGINKSSNIKDSATLQLDALTKSVDTLIIINASVLSVHDAIAGVIKAVSELAANERVKLAIQKAADDAVKAAAAQRIKDDIAAAKQSAYSNASAWTTKDFAAATYLSNGGKAQYIDFYAAGWSQVSQQVLGKFNDKATVVQWNQITSLLSKLMHDNVLQMQGRFSEMLHPVSWYGTEAKRIMGSHKDGLGYVPFDGYVAELHKGERVLTAADNMAMSAPRRDIASQELIAEIRALRKEVEQLRSESRAGNSAIAENTKATSKQLIKWDVDGLPAETVE
jgi:tape measure domain-containing protein